MRIHADKLILELIELTYQNIENVKLMLQNTMEELNWRIESNRWTALEGIAHLNLFNNFYLHELKYGINKRLKPANPIFETGMIGNYYVNLLQSTKFKIEIPKTMNPKGNILSKKILEEFIMDQYEIIWLLEDANRVNLNKTKTAVSFSRCIKFKLGDTFRFLVYYNEKYTRRALRILDSKKCEAA
ncbi:DinB family protein [Geojedonia litorea]|uniref:DinB family protein n=1 Tax=Geojedonia litorea TaxID=1268269 RepID=A0ABV9N2J6_9FLAO